MSELPLNAVENTREEISHDTGSNPNFVKSPIKLSMTEKRVIGGLKELTELLFRQHYKDKNEADQNENKFVQSEEISTSSECPSSSSIESTDKENGNFQQFLDSAMKDGAEKFCAMVVQQLTNQQHIDHHEEWHKGQLNAYNFAHEQLFETND